MKQLVGIGSKRSFAAERPDFCLGMADAAEVLAARAYTRPKREHYQKEVSEWIAPLYNRNHIIDLAAGVSAVAPSVAEKIVNFFTIDLSQPHRSGVGEGYFAPFLRLDDALLYSPHAVKRMMPERNLLYAIVRTDKKKFDDVDSQHLEPALLDDAEEFLSSLPGVEVAKNVNWDKGEIDLLAYHEGSNTGLQLQAKAGVPPQGARMIAQVESHALEAVEQLTRFLGLDADVKDQICSSAIKKPVTGVDWSSGILVRSCLGTERVWSSLQSYIPLNPVLLRAVLKKISEEGDFSFAKLETAFHETLTSLRAVALLGWENASFSLFEKNIELPLLNLNYQALAEFRSTATE